MAKTVREAPGGEEASAPETCRSRGKERCQSWKRLWAPRRKDEVQETHIALRNDRAAGVRIGIGPGALGGQASKARIAVGLRRGRTCQSCPTTSPTSWTWKLSWRCQTLPDGSVSGSRNCLVPARIEGEGLAVAPSVLGGRCLSRERPWRCRYRMDAAYRERDDRGRRRSRSSSASTSRRRPPKLGPRRLVRRRPSTRRPRWSLPIEGPVDAARAREAPPRARNRRPPDRDRAAYRERGPRRRSDPRRPTRWSSTLPAPNSRRVERARDSRQTAER